MLADAAAMLPPPRRHVTLPAYSISRRLTRVATSAVSLLLRVLIRYAMPALPRYAIFAAAYD